MEVSKYINPNIIHDGSIDGDKKIKDYPPLKKGTGFISVSQNGCSASGSYSHAEGEDSTASVEASHAEGYKTIASGRCSHAEGVLTQTKNEGEHSEGKGNISIKDKTIHTVGIGSGVPYIINKNAEEIHYNGDKYVIGIGGYNGTNSQTEGIKTVQEVVAESANAVQITYTELKALRDAGKLVPGAQYRITDYTCTTTQENTKSAEHQFDIIVTADDESTLNEVARAVKHDGDTYFDGCNLNSWQLWYSLDNDTTRFAWADATNGKGVIYRMIDEFNNDVPYDFKNIQFKHPKDATTYPYYYYTFASDNVEDNTDNSISIANHCYSNTIREYISNSKQRLNCIIFIGYDFQGYGTICNTFGANCYNNTFGKHCFGNYFGDRCHDNTFGINCSANYFSADCYGNTFGANCHDNTFGKHCLDNTFENCIINTFGNDCQLIKFASDSSASTGQVYYQYNHFGDGCKYILFKGTKTTSYPNQVQNYNFAQGLQGTSSAYLTIDGVRNRSFETKVAKKSNGELKIYCEADLIL